MSTCHRFISLCLGALAAGHAVASQTIIGNVRVQNLTKSLVRIEGRGPRGFENRATFNVVNRPNTSEKPAIEEEGSDVRLRFGNFQVLVRQHGRSLYGTLVQNQKGDILYKFEGKLPKSSFLPDPGATTAVYAVGDGPRIVPPVWGATPAPAGNKIHPETSGWDTTNDAPDIYVFVLGSGGYDQLRKDFLAVFGPSPMLPLWSFGFWDSRWYPYDEELALKSIDEYRKRGFPLDGFVVDTDWRTSGSHGYEIDKKYFPDMKRFIDRAHAKHVRLMFNDHPEPVDAALSPKELEYRWNGLKPLLDLGMDVWWYDRNWFTHLREPAPGIAAEVWGMRLFHDVTEKVRPGVRPMVMSNFQGIDNGERHYAPSPAAHRYPMMWTGDTGAFFQFLQNGIGNGVDMGVLALHPYVNEDLGAHFATPSPELYVRYLQYGAFSPVMRIHCTRDQIRYPWVFGPEADRLSREYIKLRYRLLPTLYAAARRSYEEGTPILRRLDLEWPKSPEAKDNQQFLFGDDLLVAPMNVSKNAPADTIPGSFLRTPEGEPGLTGSYFLGRELEGKPQFVRTDPQVKFIWINDVPRPGWPKENYSVRWEGTIGPMPESGVYNIGTKSDDGARLFIDGKQVINEWKGQPSLETLVEMPFEKGSTHKVVMEYFQWGGGADAALQWTLPSARKTIASRKVWLPAGTWTDIWTGQQVRGGTSFDVEAELWKTPLYIRDGALVITAPRKSGQDTQDEIRFTDESLWDELTLEAYVPSLDRSVQRELYEDDRISTQYQNDKYRKTKVSWARSGNKLSLEIDKARGTYSGALARRTWIVRLHCPKGMKLIGEGLRQLPGQTRVAENPMPFLGAGALAMPEEVVYEVAVPGLSVNTSIKLEFRIEK